MLSCLRGSERYGVRDDEVRGILFRIFGSRARSLRFALALCEKAGRGEGNTVAFSIRGFDSLPIQKKWGAGDGNRTHMIGLGSRRSATELHPHHNEYTPLNTALSMPFSENRRQQEKTGSSIFIKAIDTLSEMG